MTADEYLDAARRNRRRAFVLLGDGDAPGACFYSQQAIERAIKAVLVGRRLLDEHAREFRTHEIGDLFDVVADGGVDLPPADMVNLAERFTVCAVDLRYDERLNLPTLPDEFLAVVDAVIAWAETKTGSAMEFH